MQPTRMCARRLCLVAACLLAACLLAGVSTRLAHAAPPKARPGDVTLPKARPAAVMPRPVAPIGPPSVAAPPAALATAVPAPFAVVAPTVTGPTTGKRSGYTSYERETIANATRELGVTIDREPDGKIVESVDIVRLEVFEKRDPAPQFLNFFHHVSLDSVVRREVLLTPNSPFAETLADESARNLRKFPQLSLVLCVAVRGRTPGTVRVLVITKDTWSLRLSYDLQANAGGVDSFVLRPQETNLGGLQHTVSAVFKVVPKAYSFGAAYAIPRIGGSYVGASGNVDVTVNRDSGSAEGLQAALVVNQPLYTSRTAWGWNTEVAYGNYVVRRYSNGAQARFGSTKLPAGERIPFEYRRRGAQAKVGAVRSWGWANKFDLSFGLTVSNATYDAGDLTRYDPKLAAEYVATRVPRSDPRTTPIVQLRAYTSNFHRITDFETLGLQEDYRIGYDAYAQVYPVLEELGSARSLLGTFLSAQYTVPLGDGMVRASVESTVETQTSGVSDASLQVNFRGVTPRFGAGRVVMDAVVISRYRNYLRGLSVLGGEGRLRGYPTAFFDGQSLVAMNLEYRTRPLKLWSLQVGGVAFYDVGDTPNDLGKLNLKQSTGIGLRALFPQFNRIALRFDLALPLIRPLPAAVPAVGFFFGLEQAFQFGAAGPG
jgi:hypothetical protein